MSADNKHTTKNKKKIYTVYKHTAPNGKVYIGITGQKPEYRWNNGNGYKQNKHFYRAIVKYGWENFKHEKLYENLSEKNACDLEKKLIAKYHARDPHKGYNNSTGGECSGAGVHPSAETRRKLSEVRKGRHLSTKTRRKIGEAHKGLHLSAEARRKLSEANKGANHPNYGKHLSAETRRKIGEAQKGSNNHNYGKHPSAETRKKLSESRKGVHLSTETRLKIGEANKRAYLNPELRLKISEARKRAVVCVETGTLYSSVTEAAKSIGRAQSAISQVLRGVTKTSGGYHWKYAENME